MIGSQFNSFLLPFLVSMLPIAELRGGIPLALSTGIPPIQAYLIGVGGNTVPVLPLLLGLKYALKIIKKHRQLEKIFNGFKKKSQNKKELIHRYGIGGIVLLVAIPLPVTGAWTGSLVSFLLSIPIKYAFFAIFAGICLAGLIVLFATLGILSIGKLFIGM